MCEGYQGYANRETWSLQLWLSNDYDLYHEARSVAASGADRYEGIQALRDWVEGPLWEHLLDSHDGRNMVTDVGSLWRVEWDEVFSSLAS